MVCKQTTAGH
jgi:hypothetical protein